MEASEVSLNLPSGLKMGLDQSLAKGLRAELLATASLRSTGILKHGTHLTDPILLAPTLHRGAEACLFTVAARHLVSCLDAGRISVLNEKIDGSPAIVLGRDDQGAAFVAYKHGIERKSGPQLVRSLEDVGTFYPKSPGLAAVLREVASGLLPLIPASLPANHCIQGDLLFTSNNGARHLIEDEIAIRANTSGLEYRLARSSPFFEPALKAPLGFVLHTPALLSKGDSGALQSQPIHDPQLVLSVSRELSNLGMFACDPFRFDVPANVPAWINKRSETLAALETVERLLGELSRGTSIEFANHWTALAPKLCTFFNSFLYPPGKGGIYRAAADGEEFNFEKLKEGFARWMWHRKLAAQKPDSEEFVLGAAVLPVEEFFEKERRSLEQLLRAYYLANRVFYLMRPALNEAFRSKLGGGPAEGFMLGSLKVVDRLEFTMLNFSRPRHTRGAQLIHTLKYPFNKWRPGARFVLAKFQPPHIGHAGLIHSAVEAAAGAPVFVIASHTQPSLRAKTWRELNVSKTKKGLIERDFTYPFSRSLRRQLLKHVDPRAKVSIIDPRQFILYLGWARDNGFEGKVKLVVGEKEIAGGKYNSQLQLYGSHLELEALPLSGEGIRARQVRTAIAAASNDDKPAYETLEAALSYVKDDSEREMLIARLLTEWRKAERATKRVLMKKKKPAQTGAQRAEKNRSGTAVPADFVD